ncbi:HlyD family efflux transporter periplasmic adaptor subunit [Shimia sp.]|uniref:HlyD family efflux transporter periplasmic adaptor subunit n=1 Tax=Shimia sp. TaxID=1954381 RepID=UPI003569096D
MTAPAADLAPPRSLRAAPWLWCGWALLCTLVLVAAAAILSHRVGFADLHRYPGALAPRAGQTDVVLPAGIPVAGLLVAEGEPVTAGQRLVLLDEDRLRQRIEGLERALMLAAARRDCLLGQPVPKAADLPGTGLDADTDTDTGRALQAALEECTLIHRRNLLRRRQLIESRDALRQRAGLALQGLGALAPAPPDALSARARALRLTLEKQRLDSALRQLEIALAVLVVDQDLALLREVAALQEHSARKAAELAALERHAAQPWLIAPDSGRVRRLRPLSGQSSFAADMTLLQLGHEDRDTFEARVEVPAPQAGQMRIGDPVAIRLSGLALTMPPVAGTVARLEDSPGRAAPERMMRVTVEIAPGRIADPLLREAVTALLEAGRGRATIALSGAPMTLLERLSRVLAELAGRRREDPARGPAAPPASL